MRITPDEVSVMKRALEYRKEWIDDEQGDTQELKDIVSILDKLKSLNYWLETKEWKA